MTPTLRSRHGFALPVAIGAIVLIGTMLAGIFFAVTQESRIGKNTATQEKAFRTAEGGINTALAFWKAANYSGLVAGKPDTITKYDSTSTAGYADTVVVTKLTSNMFMVVSTARAGSSALATMTMARRRSGLVVKLLQPKFNFLGALTVQGSLNVGGSSNINGNDQTPSGWPCSGSTTNMPGIATNSGSNLSFGGSCSDLSCVSGSPKVDTTAAAADSTTYFSYGDANWNSLVAMASIVYPSGTTVTNIGPVVTNGVCDKTTTQNWGDPNRANPAGPCESYFPIIYFGGSGSTANISGGTGQGILLVEGDLQVQGGFTFYGPVIVRGHLKTTGTGGHFFGGVMAANVDLEQNTVLGNAIINYSSCAVQTAILGASGGSPVAQRSWTELF